MRLRKVEGEYKGQGRVEKEIEREIETRGGRTWTDRGMRTKRDQPPMEERGIEYAHLQHSRATHLNTGQGMTTFHFHMLLKTRCADVQ